MSAAKTLMIQGTGSHAGKTVIVAAICRILSEAGYTAAPFKAQNMALNSAVTQDGGEIARAQALQAYAAGIEPSVYMNPILLKPKSTMSSQIIILGKPYRDCSIQQYYRQFVRRKGIRVVQESLSKLMSEFDVVVIEGAGNPAEPNLYDYDIVNMRVAELVNSPVILLADIERGGAFASVFGTFSLLKKRHRNLVAGFIINKFKGDPIILQPALRMLQELTGKPVLGVIPFIDELLLPWEDSLSLENLSSKQAGGLIDVAVVKLPYIANFTDLAPFLFHGLTPRLVTSPSNLGRPDAIIIPGTKNTVEALRWLKKVGLDYAIKMSKTEGVPIVGICGGYQLLGRKILDPKGLEGGSPGQYEGLGLLTHTTTFEGYEKEVSRVEVEVVGQGPILGKVRRRKVKGYEVHMGKTIRGTDKPLLKVISPKRWDDVISRYDGSVSPDGLVFGSYLHGIFDTCLTSALLQYIAEKKGASAPFTQNAEDPWNAGLELLCGVMKRNVDLKKILEIADIGWRCPGKS